MYIPEDIFLSFFNHFYREVFLPLTLFSLFTHLVCGFLSQAMKELSSFSAFFSAAAAANKHQDHLLCRGHSSKKRRFLYFDSL